MFYLSLAFGIKELVILAIPLFILIITFYTLKFEHEGYKTMKKAAEELNNSSLEQCSEKLLKSNMIKFRIFWASVFLIIIALILV
jgi:hypothetical protein